jgi:hypothetical protein
MSLWRIGGAVEPDVTDVPAASSTSSISSSTPSIESVPAAPTKLEGGYTVGSPIDVITQTVAMTPEAIRQMQETLPSGSEVGFAKKAFTAVAPIAAGALTGAMLPAAVAPGLSLATRAGKLIHGLLTGAGYATGELAAEKWLTPEQIYSTSSDEATFQKEQADKDAATTKKFLLNVLVPFLGEAGSQIIHALPPGQLGLLGKTVKSVIGGGGGAWLADYLSGRWTGKESEPIETAGVMFGGAVGQTMADTMRSLTQGPNLNDPNVQTAIKYGLFKPETPNAGVPGIMLQGGNTARAQMQGLLKGVSTPEAEAALRRSVEEPAALLGQQFPRAPEEIVRGATRTLQTTAEGAGPADVRQRLFTPPGEVTPISPANRAVRTILPEVQELPAGEEWMKAVTSATKESADYMGRLVKDIDPNLKPNPEGKFAAPQNILDNAYRTTGSQYGALQKTMARLAGEQPIPVPQFEQAILDFNKHMNALGLPSTEAMAKESDKYIKELTERTFTANELLEKMKHLKAMRDSLAKSGSRLDNDGLKLYRRMVAAADEDVAAAVQKNSPLANKATQAVIDHFGALSGKYRVFSAMVDATESSMKGERLLPGKLRSNIEAAVPDLGEPGQRLLSTAAAAAESPTLQLPGVISKAKQAGGFLKLAQTGDKAFWRQVQADPTGDTETRLIYEILNKVTAPDGTLNGADVSAWMTAKANRGVMSNLSAKGKAALANVAADPALIKTGFIEDQLALGKALRAAPDKRGALVRLMSEEGGISPMALDAALLSDKNGKFRKLIGDIVAGENIRNPTTGAVEPNRLVNYLNVTEPERLAAYTSPEAIQIMNELKPLIEQYGSAIDRWPTEIAARLDNKIRGLSSIMGTGSAVAANAGAPQGAVRNVSGLAAMVALIQVPGMIQNLIVRNWTPAQISRRVGAGRVLSNVIGVEGTNAIFGKKEGTTKYAPR